MQGLNLTEDFSCLSSLAWTDSDNRNAVSSGFKNIDDYFDESFFAYLLKLVSLSLQENKKNMERMGLHKKNLQEIENCFLNFNGQTAKYCFYTLLGQIRSLNDKLRNKILDKKKEKESGSSKKTSMENDKQFFLNLTKAPFNLFFYIDDFFNNISKLKSSEISEVVQSRKILHESLKDESSDGNMDPLPAVKQIFSMFVYSKIRFSKKGKEALEKVNNSISNEELNMDHYKEIQSIHNLNQNFQQDLLNKQEKIDKLLPSTASNPSSDEVKDIQTGNNTSLTQSLASTEEIAVSTEDLQELYSIEDEYNNIFFQYLLNYIKLSLLNQNIRSLFSNKMQKINDLRYKISSFLKKKTVENNALNIFFDQVLFDIKNLNISDEEKKQPPYNLLFYILKIFEDINHDIFPTPALLSDYQQEASLDKQSVLGLSCIFLNLIEQKKRIFKIEKTFSDQLIKQDSSNVSSTENVDAPQHSEVTLNEKYKGKKQKKAKKGKKKEEEKEDLDAIFFDDLRCCNQKNEKSLQTLEDKANKLITAEINTLSEIANTPAETENTPSKTENTPSKAEKTTSYGSILWNMFACLGASFYMLGVVLSARCSSVGRRVYSACRSVLFSQSGSSVNKKYDAIDDNSGHTASTEDERKLST